MDHRAHVQAFWFLLEWNLHHDFFFLLKTQVGLELTIFSPVTQFPMPGLTGIHYDAHLFEERHWGAMPPGRNLIFTNVKFLSSL